MAIKAQETLLKVETARATAKVITNITAANPPVVSSTAHGYSDGDVVYISGVTGMDQVNSRAFVVDDTTGASPLTPNSFELKGIDGTGYTAYEASSPSTGSAYKVTLTTIAEVSSVAGFDGQAPEIDTTHLRSTAKEFLLGLQDFGNLTLNIFLKNADAGQTELRTLKSSGDAAVFTITLSDDTVAAFVGRVSQLTFSAERDGAVSGQVTIRITGEPAWFA